MVRSKPYILSCSEEKHTKPSLSHQPILGAILLIMRHPTEYKKTRINIFDDKKPFDRREEFDIDTESYKAYVSIDRRTNKE